MLTHWKKAKYFTYRCKKWVMQFVVVKLVTTLLMYLIYPNEQQELNGDAAAPANHSVELFLSSVVSWVVAISASYSLYYLVLFYHALSRPLAPYAALLKFLTIKITIFFTFWQKIMIGIFEEQLLSCFDTHAPAFHKLEILSSLEVNPFPRRTRSSASK
jgi:magnesium-transporting ATPase (P-type)